MAQKEYFLKLFLGLVMVAAAAWRIFHWPQAQMETRLLGITFGYMPYIIVALELFCGFFLITNFKPKAALLILALFLAGALLHTVLVFPETLLSNAKELFVFDATPTDFFLHFTYFIIVLYLLFPKKQN